MSRVAFLFDAATCTGCEACVVACALENDLGEESWRQVATHNAAHRPELPVVHLSIACNHCDDPPCMDACPALAYSKDPASGLVTLHADRCIGCRYCSWACPYDAPRFSVERGVMTKCTFCSHRQAEGLLPACVAQCPTGALGFGELETLSGEEDALGMPTLAPGPAIRFVPGHPRPPESAAPAGAPRLDEAAPQKITLRSEWPLVGFTLLAAWLVSAEASTAIGRPAFSPGFFAWLAMSSLVLSSRHLGQKLRAWRAILNVRRSWLSREVVLYSAFVGLALLHRLFLPNETRLAAVTTGVGFAALFAIDRVYDLVRTRRRMHSADVLRTGILLTALWIGHLPLAAAFGALKLYLYLTRKFGDGWKRPEWALLRLWIGFVFPVVMYFLDPERWTLWALAGAAVGELVDRCEFYAGLRVPTPRGEMRRRESAYAT